MTLINELRMLAEDLHVNGYNRYSAAMSKAADELDKWGAVVGAVLMAVVSALVLDQSADRGALALGALSGAAGGAGSATVNQESIIKNCMNGRGYKVLR